MHYWMLIFLTLTLISGTLGFTNINIISADIAQVTFFVFLLFFLLSLTEHLTRSAKDSPD